VADQVNEVPPVLSPSDVAEIVGCSRRAAFRLMAAIGGRRFQRSWRIYRDSFLEACENGDVPLWTQLPTECLLGAMRASKPTGSHVYIVRAGSAGRPIKIGVTERLESRMDEIRAGCPDDIATLVVFHGTEVHESILHTRFAELRLHHEWFRSEGALAKLAALAEEELPC
jgi:hypothetical protein